jgi:hypothetical protein
LEVVLVLLLLPLPSACRRFFSHVGDEVFVTKLVFKTPLNGVSVSFADASAITVVSGLDISTFSNIRLYAQCIGAVGPGPQVTLWITEPAGPPPYQIQFVLDNFQLGPIGAGAGTVGTADNPFQVFKAYNFPGANLAIIADGRVLNNIPGSDRIDLLIYGA